MAELLETNDLMLRGEAAMCTMGHLAVSLAPGVFSTCSLAVTTKNVCRL